MSPLAMPWEPGQPTPTTASTTAATSTTSSPTRVELPTAVPVRLLEREPVGLQRLTSKRPSGPRERAEPGDGYGAPGDGSSNAAGRGNSAGDVRPATATDDAANNGTAGDITADDVAPRDDAADVRPTEHHDPAPALNRDGMGGGEKL